MSTNIDGYKVDNRGLSSQPLVYEFLFCFN